MQEIVMDIKGKISEAAKALEQNYAEEKIFETGIGVRLPKRSEITDVIKEARRLMFPGYFGRENAAYVPMNNFAGDTLAIIYEKLFKQIRIALLYQEKKVNPTGAGTEEIESMAEEMALCFIDSLPGIQKMIIKDVEAELAGDPAAGNKEEIIFSYPGILAIFVYRIAHVLYEQKVPFIPRIMTEYVHSQTGIDINPGAVIGEYFFIDHGTGIVIGETTEIGNNVKIYQGVTLGALSTLNGRALAGVKRHPTIEDNVVIYANATVLGGNTVIGRNSVIAGNTFVTESIPANTRVSATVPKLQFQKR